jgi:hypothetical protein
MMQFWCLRIAKCLHFILSVSALSQTDTVALPRAVNEKGRPYVCALRSQEDCAFGCAF